VIRKKLKWYPLFENQEQLEELFMGKNAAIHRSMFGTVLLAKSNGEFYAFKNKCPHQNKPLEDCTIENGNVVCSFHRYHFSLEDGRGHGLCLDKYELKIENDQVFLGKEVWSLF
jgi:nitrite reductase/ring-hydroxylating ferredoxin subunit